MLEITTITIRGAELSVRVAKKPHGDEYRVSCVEDERWCFTWSGTRVDAGEAARKIANKLEHDKRAVARCLKVLCYYR